MTLSKIVLTALIAGSAFAGAALAMDTNACRDFVQGTWSIKPATPGDQMVKVTYNADGTYQRGADGAGAPEAAAAGSWEVVPAKVGDCEVMLTPANAAPRAINLTKTGVDGFLTAEGEMATREPDAQPALIN